MKNLIKILVISLPVLLLSSCKNPAINYDTFTITDETIQSDAHQATITVSYDFIGQVTAMKLVLGLTEDLSDADTYPMTAEQQCFTKTVDNLEPGANYHYCYLVEFGPNYKITTDMGNFNTLSEKPKVRTLDVTAMGDMTFRVKCIVEQDGGAAITERGICWNKTGNPTINNEHIAHQTNTTGEYSCQMSGLELNSTYYVRAYAKNNMGISYANEVLHFDTDSPETPSVETMPVSNITQTSAVCHGQIVSSGTSSITEYGICWGTSEDPDTNGSHLSGNLNVTEFSFNIDDLSVGTVYYVRAYAVNNEGTGYGASVRFETLPLSVYHINVESNPNNGGSVTGAGDYQEGDQCTVSANANEHYDFQNWTEGTTVVTESPNYNFTVNRNRTLTANFTLKYYSINVSVNPEDGGRVEGAGTYEYGNNCTLKAIAGNDFEFKKWTENGNTISTDESITFTVESNRTLEAHFQFVPSVPEGAIGGLFSTGSGKVYFSKGNLQYKASSHVWQFAPNQYSTIGSGNANISPTYSNWIDLFGWGTGDNPTNTSINNADYNNFHDWGDNPISNGGNMIGFWRTLTKEEWKYIFNTREASTINGVRNARYAKATVNNVGGIILFPDTYIHPSGVPTPQNINIPNPSNGYASNNYSAYQWGLMETNGCVFLPVTGNRKETIFDYSGNGYYWSSSRSGTIGSGLFFDSNVNLNPEFGTTVIIGESVRLVHNYQ